MAQVHYGIYEAGLLSEHVECTQDMTLLRNPLYTLYVTYSNFHDCYEYI